VSVRIARPAPRVAELIMDRPEALNAISTAQAEALAAASDELAVDRSVAVVIVSSTSMRAFCVGADLKERRDFSDDDLARQRPATRAAYGGILGLPMPTIAAVEGYALGGGLELALACDLIVASASAVLGMPEVGVGLIPGGGGTQLLARRLGPSRAADLIFTARRVDAAEAWRLGVVDRLVDAGGARTAALELARTISANSPRALRHAKAALQGGLGADLASGLALENEHWEAVAFSADRREGIAAFNEGRAPRWPDPHQDRSGPDLGSTQ
jgi:enoyl-CoA hydratase/carnithine racemase